MHARFPIFYCVFRVTFVRTAERRLTARISCVPLQHPRHAEHSSAADLCDVRRMLNRDSSFRLSIHVSASCADSCFFGIFYKLRLLGSWNFRSSYCPIVWKNRPKTNISILLMPITKQHFSDEKRAGKARPLQDHEILQLTISGINLQRVRSNTIQPICTFSLSSCINWWGGRPQKTSSNQDRYS